jgi:hypothetical protein
VIFPLITFPEQCLELLREPINVALPLLTTPPPLQNAVAQQPQEPAEYHPTHEEWYGYFLRLFPSRPSPSLGTSITAVREVGFTVVAAPMALAMAGSMLSSTAQKRVMIMALGSVQCGIISSLPPCLGSVVMLPLISGWDLCHVHCLV